MLPFYRVTMIEFNDVCQMKRRVGCSGEDGKLSGVGWLDGGDTRMRDSTCSGPPEHVESRSLVRLETRHYFRNINLV